MAYTKPQLLCQDMPLTFQMVNTIQGNLDNHWLLFSRWHGTRETSSGFGGVAVTPPPAYLYGSHNDKRIPRVVISVSNLVVSTGVAQTQPTVVRGMAGIIGPTQYQGAGVLDVTVYLTDYYAVCTPLGDGLAGALRMVIPTSIYGSQGATPALRFESYEHDGTNFVPADFDFVAHIYGSP